VVENARRRWPAVRFRICEVAVQGVNAVSEVNAAIEALDADAEIEVIVITRGGGSVEDLLPFSNEAMIRAVSACRTPVVSAIGHESDIPLLDLVADARASTPTDAAKHVVPDVAEQAARIGELRQRADRAVRTRLDREGHLLASLRSRPVLSDPAAAMNARERDLAALRDRLRLVLDKRLERARDDLDHIRARVLALSPAATLERGYAVVQRADGRVVRRPGDLDDGEEVRLRLAEGEVAAAVKLSSTGAGTP
jgi:exodeoxyribonuclease VII large subunit